MKYRRFYPLLTCPVIGVHFRLRVLSDEMTSDRVALGDCSPRAPTDPYVRTLAHTVPLIMASLRAGDSNGQCELEQAGNGDG
jgi:hypothetical protein